jgi:hypothetical protein
MPRLPMTVKCHPLPRFPVYLEIAHLFAYPKAFGSQDVPRRQETGFAFMLSLDIVL